ncbi:MAG: hypothetical protein KDA41_11010, partial [Planctomycetales bacterium]|nr:hypothetical protein [Planctomycetales bacterium]
VRRHVDDAARRDCEAQLQILSATSRLAELFLARERFDREAAATTERRQALEAVRAECEAALEALRSQMQKSEGRCHRVELAVEQARSEREHLAQRLADDYGLDLAAMQSDESDEQSHEREAVEQEIADLRRKINNVGAVNLEALDELEQLEERFASLSGQFNDLKDAKLALEKIIQRINADSRRLFTDTLEAIRVNFQALYRKLFGGGHADLVLEEGVDILEAGIEIVANPPGKPAFSNSLLSGGEQGLTAVSLLLAIFQHRPSPFCVLDEVDAPLDESNVGRFTEVLREFLKWTRFIIVTHSKKTMTAATTLYGVTMQEPNVSKRVSVRFEDVSEQGEIRQSALDAQPQGTGDDERAA